MYALEALTRAVAFAAGDLRRQPGFPWFTTSVREPKISLGEACEAVVTARYGDVGLHRDSDYFTNLTIPGAMKHAWIHTDDINSERSYTGGLIVEATSEGVLSKHALTPYHDSDYAVLLRPKGVTDEQRKGACVKANGIVGASYDTNFTFDIENELHFYDVTSDQDLKEATKALSASEAALQKWHHAFSCSEAVSYSWWHCRKELSLYRRKFMGKDVILPVDFIHHGFDIVWASESWSLDTAQRQGLNEEGLDMLNDFRNHG